MVWVSPTGHNDPDEFWGNTAGYEEEKAYDDDTGTRCTGDTMAGAGWTPFLELTISALNCNKVRIWNTFSAGTIDIDAYYNGGWHDVYEGPPTANQWKEHELGDTYSVTKARFRTWHDAAGWQASVNEFDFGVVETTAYKDTATRFKLSMQTSQDVSTRFFLYQPTWEEIQIQKALAALKTRIVEPEIEPGAHFRI